MKYSDKIKLLLLFTVLITAKISFTQHDHQKKEVEKDTMKMDSMQMTSFFSPNLPMSRDGSWTSWQPNENPMWIYMK